MKIEEDFEAYKREVASNNHQSISQNMLKIRMEKQRLSEMEKIHIEIEENFKSSNIPKYAEKIQRSLKPSQPVPSTVDKAVF